MSYEFYKTIHYVSLMALLISLIFIVFIHTKGSVFKENKKFIYALHGISWITLFGSAHGLVSTTGLSEHFPVWAMVKTGIWVVLGTIPLLIKRMPAYVYINSFIIVSLVTSAIYLAVYKPF